MSGLNRTPPVPSPTASSYNSPKKVEGPAALSVDGLDLRRYAALSPLEQLDRLQTDLQRLTQYERNMRTAEAGLAEISVNTKEVTP